MHAHSKDRSESLRFFLSVAILFGAAAADVAGAQSHTQGSADAAFLARAALGPYADAQAYRGALSVTTVIGKDRCELNRTTSILARCDRDGTLLRLHAQTISWGHQEKRDVTGEADTTLIFDGATLWIYRLAEQRYCSASGKMPSLMTLLGLPPADASWSFARRNDLLPGQRGVCARVGDVTWTLILDCDTGRLHHVERVRQRGKDRLLTTIVLRDLAFDAAVKAPESRFTFLPPEGAQRDIRPTLLKISLMPEPSPLP